ncbi:hypothetical protein F5148DRAFT_1165766 [Russula earlei]|uniref:Uncharacterized protein n=1 Tax=Russula earlei TaxID=71964 RepID=A0ACC0UKC9_9AGAM|nr:hypothetical protein F5148DRAFT_1165766 [Russula earlei]
MGSNYNQYPTRPQGPTPYGPPIPCDTGPFYDPPPRYPRSGSLPSARIICNTGAHTDPRASYPGYDPGSTYGIANLPPPDSRHPLWQGDHPANDRPMSCDGTGPLYRPPEDTSSGPPPFPPFTSGSYSHSSDVGWHADPWRASSHDTKRSHGNANPSRGSSHGYNTERSHGNANPAAAAANVSSVMQDDSSDLRAGTQVQVRIGSNLWVMGAIIGVAHLCSKLTGSTYWVEFESVKGGPGKPSVGKFSEADLKPA